MSNTHVCGFVHVMFKELVTGLETFQRRVAMMIENILKLPQRLKRLRLHTWQTCIIIIKRRC